MSEREHSALKQAKEYLSLRVEIASRFREWLEWPWPDRNDPQYETVVGQRSLQSADSLLAITKIAEALAAHDAEHRP